MPWHYKPSLNYSNYDACCGKCQHSPCECSEYEETPSDFFDRDTQPYLEGGDEDEEEEENQRRFRRRSKW